MVCMLQPTTPLRSIHDCRNVADILRTQASTDSVISVVEASQHPYKLVRKAEAASSSPFRLASGESARQTLPLFYSYNGAFYATRTDVFKEKQSFKGITVPCMKCRLTGL